MVRPEDHLSLSFFQRLLTSDDNEALVDGCRELVLGNEEKALEHLRQVVHLADGAYLAGFLALKKERLEEATDYLATAAEKHSRLGCYFSKYGISATLSLPIADEVSAHVGPDLPEGAARLGRGLPASGAPAGRGDMFGKTAIGT